MWTLISASPSPYARKVRIALAEKGVPFTLQTEVPWDGATVTPQYNPLEKLPVLILDNGECVYESHYILEWLEAKHPEPALLPSDIDERLFAKKVEVVCDGMCDAMVIAFFERLREPEKQSEPWKARQMRKVEGGLRQLSTWIDQRQGQYLIGDRLTIADLAIAAFLGWFAIRWSEHQWQSQYPKLKQYWEELEALPHFKETRPSPQTIKDQVV
ncbi:hypothetical protein LTR35_009766 [Friedmanniomyces endolithicus]|uniref:Glutathione S-transferase n=1 Tax=Friedmanniomyces endolithicus TaxID=329885 RepID=A0AAN6J9E2_9PEZI|nr:hypothetical protein LTR35_009766 [Friedmanniomyces endolithicus]KAK0301030.1 hypothetical protein LTS00_000178 [Friedmanniomyces endolithicus]KAK0321382.1 hypothetical protein LTR82_007835 [Friedmanniomyces endolithicus]KAK1018893.1 hypothetical protein LTR54_000705 [Friedmanniomyces endolithicus]